MAFRDASRIPTFLLAISRLEHQVMRVDIPPWCVDRFESDSEPTTLTISPIAAGSRLFQPSRLHAAVYTQVARSTRAQALNLVTVIFFFWFLSKGFEPTCTESSPLIPLDSLWWLRPVHSNLIHCSNKNQPYSQSVRERRDRACSSCHSSSTMLCRLPVQLGVSIWTIKAFSRSLAKAPSHSHRVESLDTSRPPRVPVSSSIRIQLTLQPRTKHIRILSAR
jgi:hypothetical protein